MKSIINTKKLTLVALLFYIIGFVGIGVFHNNLVYRATPYHLLLMFVLLVISGINDFRNLFWWLLIAYMAGFGAEWIGIHKSWLFGSYYYTHALGYSWQKVPLLIGCNWIIVVSGGICLALEVSSNRLVVSLLAATCATFFDWVLEPAAIKLDFWHWNSTQIPEWNYGSWWLVSFILALFWTYFKVRPNQFAINLFIIQLLFFSLLRSMI